MKENSSKNTLGEEYLEMKTRRGSSNSWLSENLDMGTPSYVSQNISEFEKSKAFKKKMYENMIEKSKTWHL